MNSTMNSRIAGLLLVSVIICVGCTPGVKIRKNPDDTDTGVRYYRPKPYLVVKPSQAEKVSLEIEYLPDFSEEYSVNVRPGLGQANVSLSLENGWNLTQVNQDLDTKLDENLNAIANVLTQAASSAKGATDTSWECKADGVPIGYYEAVIGKDNCGKKRHFGWRYIGFAPYNSCPTNMFGSDCAGCQDDMGAVFGLIVKGSTIHFQKLSEMPNSPHSSATKQNIDDKVAEEPPAAEKPKKSKKQPKKKNRKPEAKTEEIDIEPVAQTRAQTLENVDSTQISTESTISERPTQVTSPSDVIEPAKTIDKTIQTPAEQLLDDEYTTMSVDEALRQFGITIDESELNILEPNDEKIVKVEISMTEREIALVRENIPNLEESLAGMIYASTKDIFDEDELKVEAELVLKKAPIKVAEASKKTNTK